MADVEILKLNESNVYIKTDGGIAAEISDFFKFRPPGFQFMPAYKAKKWDGYIRLFNTMERTLQMGILPRLLSFLKNYGYSVSIDKKLEVTNKAVPRAKIEEFCKSLKLQSKGKDITPFEHQIDAIEEGINNRRAVLLSPTASGKSLIQYCLIRWFLGTMPDDKILLIVPTTSLVTQMQTDFADYSSKNGWDADAFCHQIMAGREKETECPVVISTWQSIYKLNKKWFSEFYTILGDECHLFKAQSLSSIMTKSENAAIRIGLTGTVDSKTVHKLQLEGSFGPITRVAHTHELQKKGHLAQINIRPIKLSYNDECRKLVKSKSYQEEIKWLEEYAPRNKVIANLACAQFNRPGNQGNTLVLFNKITHGEELYRLIKEQAKDGQEVMFVAGKVKTEDREVIRQKMMASNNAIIVASFGVYSTGINIPNVHNIILASTSKSEIRVLQSIGRGLRNAVGKTHMILYDMFDDLKWKKHENYSLKHFLERLNIYVKERFEYSIHKITMD